MSGKTPSFDPLIVSIRTLLASPQQAEDKVRLVIDLIELHLGSVNASLCLRSEENQPVAFADRQSLSRGSGRFAFNRQIIVGGVSRGHFALEVDEPRGGAARWLRTLQAITDELASFAESAVSTEGRVAA